MEALNLILNYDLPDKWWPYIRHTAGYPQLVIDSSRWVSFYPSGDELHLYVNFRNSNWKEEEPYELGEGRELPYTRENILYQLGRLEKLWNL